MANESGYHHTTEADKTYYGSLSDDTSLFILH